MENIFHHIKFYFICIGLLSYQVSINEKTWNLIQSMFIIFRNRAKKNSFTGLILTFLLLKIMFDSVSRILLFSTWLYVINEGQFSSSKTIIAYYLTLLYLLIFNTIFNKQKDYTSARTWIGRIFLDLPSWANLYDHTD